MLPQPDEEVIVGFEHGDTRRPIVVGSLFNGRDKPGDGAAAEPATARSPLLSNEKIHQHSKKDFEIKSDQNMTVEIQRTRPTRSRATTRTRRPATATSRPSST